MELSGRTLFAHQPLVHERYSDHAAFGTQVAAHAHVEIRTRSFAPRPTPKDGTAEVGQPASAPAGSD